MTAVPPLHDSTGAVSQGDEGGIWVAEDAVVIGGGPAGYASALHLAQRGMSVTMVTDEPPGGTCLHRGCVPSKTLLEAAKWLNLAGHASTLGLYVEGSVAVDLPALQARKRRIVETLSHGLQQLLTAAGVSVVVGQGSILPGDGLGVRVRGAESVDIEADAVVLALGSRPASLPVPGANLPGVLTSDQLLDLEEVPRRLCIVGGGALGCEFASAFHAFGSEVTVLEALPHLLPMADEEVSRRLEASFRRQGITVKTGVGVQDMTPGLCVRTADGGVVEADTVLVATGRWPRTEGAGLAEAGVNRGSRGEILVDAQFRTTRPGVWAVGDAIGGPMLAHAGFAQAAVVAAHVVGQDPPVFGPVPHPVFCEPEVAWVGQTAQQAPEAQVVRIPYAALGKARAMGDTEGFCKVLAGHDGRILGVHYVGPGATELVGMGALALSQGLSVHAMESVVLPHPTMSEGLGEAVLAFIGRPLHVPAVRPGVH